MKCGNGSIEFLLGRWVEKTAEEFEGSIPRVAIPKELNIVSPLSL